jgi:hypothetical protein
MRREKLIKPHMSHLPEVGQKLLITRVETCKMLSISDATCRRLEAAGQLAVVKLTGRPQSKAFHRVADVLALAAGRR